MMFLQRLLARIGENMISKDSEITKEFIKVIFEATHKRWYVEHALGMIEDETIMSKIIDFVKSNKSVSWQDIEYEILANT